MARATKDGAERYVHFFEQELVPGLGKIDGHRGAQVLLRPEADGADVEITVLTYWESMEAVSRFAGDDVTRSVVEPEARACLTSFDAKVQHLLVPVDVRR